MSDTGDGTTRAARTVYDTIRSKRDRREYEDRPIDDDVLGRILQAGRMAGSAKDRQPVHLVVIRDAEQKQRIAACGEWTPHVIAAPVVVALVLQPEEEAPPGEFAIFRGPFDAGRAAQNMMLTAWAEGVTSCPASMHQQEQACAVLGLPPGYVIANLIAFGYPAARTGPVRRPRRPLDETVHLERW